MDARNVDLVRRSIDLFTQGMRPVVQAAMERRYDVREAGWVTAAWQGIKRNPGTADKPAADAQFLIECLEKHWQADFGKSVPRETRSYVGLVREARNRLAGHYDAGASDITPDDAYDAIRPTRQVLQAFRRPEEHEVLTLLDEIRRRQTRGGTSTSNGSAPLPRSPVSPPLPPPNGTRGMPYPGNLPSNVAKDAKYSLGLDGTIRLLFYLGNHEETLLTTRSHPALARQIGELKEEFDEPPGGVFYINEYGHVLVKAGGGTWYAGTYRDLLEFEFEGHTISPRARAGMRTGDRWTGPHVGVRYTLAATGHDIFYRRVVRPGVERKELLSQHVDVSRIVGLARQTKQNGGRLYVNEARVLFAPVQRTTLEYVYLGEVDLDEWFPEPKLEG